MKQQHTPSNITKKAWGVKPSPFRAYMLLALAAPLFLSATPATAAEQQKLVYEVYAGGINAVEANLTLTLNEKKKRYDIVLDAVTRGLLGKIVPWSGTFESHGWILNDGSFRPEIHKSTTRDPKETEISDYRYNKDGTFKSLHMSDKHSKNELRETTPELTDHTIDAMTAALQVFEDYKKTGKCDGSSEVFDGKRRFLQTFKHIDKDTLKPTKYNAVSGPAAECVVEVTPLAGQWHEKPRGWMSIQEQGRERGMMPTLWLGRLQENAVPVPVKIRIKTAYGTLFMHLAEYQSGDLTLTAEKRANIDN